MLIPYGSRCIAYLLVVLTSCVLCSPATAQESSTSRRSFVGEVLPVRPLPAGLTSIYQGLVGHAEYPARGIVVVHDGATWRIWLQRVASYGVTAPTSWVVLDEVVLDVDYAPEDFFPPFECSVDGESVRGLVAFGAPVDASATVAVAHAWLAEGEALREVAPDRVRCEHAQG